MDLQENLKHETVDIIVALSGTFIEDTFVNTYVCVHKFLENFQCKNLNTTCPIGSPYFTVTYIEKVIVTKFLYIYIYFCSGITQWCMFVCWWTNQNKLLCA